MSLPLIAIVGRPNVGKSSLFNRILGRQEALAFPEPGVTRDRKYAETDWNGKKFSIVDTGGMDLGNESDTGEKTRSEIVNQAKIAVKESDLIVFVVDGRDGITALDKALADYLRKENKPVFFVINKIDNKEQEQASYVFYEMGWEKIYCVSCAHGRNISELLDDIIQLPVFKKETGPGTIETKDNSIKIAIVGKPNAGKSSLVNNILGENRVIVDPAPGTTRDSIDTCLDYKSRKFILIDTAGLRKKAKIKDNLEKIIMWQTIKSINRCDIALLLIDAAEGIGMQEMKIADLIIQANKACIFVVNKWDLIDKGSNDFKDYRKFISERFPALSFAPVFFASAKTGENVKKILEGVPVVYSNYSRKISTHLLNKFIWDLKMEKSPPAVKNTPVKIKYMTQVGVRPPVFCLTIKGFLMHNYIKYLKKGLYKEFDFSGTPLVIKFKQ